MSANTADIDNPETGVFYDVDPELMRRFAKATVAERLQWLDETREFLIAASTPEVQAQWARIRGRAWLTPAECEELRQRPPIV